LASVVDSFLVIFDERQACCMQVSLFINGFFMQDWTERRIMAKAMAFVQTIQPVTTELFFYN